MKTVRIKTNYGTMIAELNDDVAPKTVENFINYVTSGFYDNTLFHRVISNFMIQGGGLETGMYSKATNAAIQNEATNGLKNEKFTLAMARTPDPHSATSQFFINIADNDFLNHSAPTDDGYGYCVFGRITDGLDVALKISEVATEERSGYQDVPVQDVVIEVVEVVEITEEEAEEPPEKQPEEPPEEPPAA